LIVATCNLCSEFFHFLAREVSFANQEKDRRLTIANYSVVQ